MSELDTSFTFRLNHADKTALAKLADRLGCDRGAVLRRMIRQSSLRPTPHKGGQFTVNGQAFPLRLSAMERVE